VDLEGKTAVVTGASSGFGAATVRKLREAGARVVGGARRVERIEADLALPLDVTDEESCAAFVGRAASELGGIDILYNNAGLALGRYPFTESNAEDEATVLHTNVDGAIRITRLALPHVRDEGHILFTGSIAGRQAYENAAVYVAAKFALRGSCTACARTSSAGRSGSPPSIRDSPRPSSRSCASAATPSARRRPTRASSA
jgi:NADP-dependent 3-hydroxy acid dehydrogenase YdfG